MKRIILTSILSIAALSSCGPLSFTMDVEMRNTSKSGLDLGRKTFAVVYADDGDRQDSLFAASLSEGFASRMETEYFGGEQVVGIYRIDRYDDSGYASKDTLLNILMDTGSDVVFLFDTPDIGAFTKGMQTPVKGSSVSEDSSFVTEFSVPFSLNLYVYDSMYPKDTVFHFSGTSVAKPVVYSGGMDTDNVLLAKAVKALAEPGTDAGRNSAQIFLSTWKSENHTVMYYESPEWYSAASAAAEYRWKDALDIWLRLLDTGNMEKRSCAEYNIALACYMAGDYSLALEWLDRSDSDYMLYISRALRQNIRSRMK